MGSDKEVITEKSDDIAPVKVMSVWDRSRQAVIFAVSRFGDKLRRTYTELTGQTEEAEYTAAGERVEWVIFVDEEKHTHKVNKADALRSCSHIASRNGYFPKCKVFEIEEPTIIVQWLVRLISEDVPPVDKLSFDSALAVDLYAAAKLYGIDGPHRWIYKLLEARVAMDPWECLATAWKGPRMNLCLVDAVILLLPSYDILSFATSVHAQVMNLTSAERLCLYPVGRHITLVTKHGPLTVDFPPFFAFALAITRGIELTPISNKKAARGDASALRQLLLSVLLEYGHTWCEVNRLGKSSEWIAGYLR